MSVGSPSPLVPLYSAVYTLERRTLFRLCLWLGAPMTGILVLWCAVLWLCSVIAAMPEYTWAMFQLVASYHATWWWGIIFLLVGTLPGILYLRSRRQKVLGIPALYSFDARGIQISCALFESRILWEYFHSWREVGDFFILNDGVRHVFWPKGAFPEEAVDAFRGLTEPPAHKK